MTRPALGLALAAVVSAATSGGAPAGVVATRHLQRIQTDGGTLQVIEEISVRNAAQPPRTIQNQRLLEIQVPPGAEIVASAAQHTGGRPFAVTPAPGAGEGLYYFTAALPPGDTRLAVAYRLPYSGAAGIEPKILLPVRNYVVVLPKSMPFEAANPRAFRRMPDRGGAAVRVAAAVQPGQPLAFRVSGTGRLAGTEPLRGVEAGPAAVPVAAPPRAAPDVERWFLFTALSVVLLAGAAGLLRARRRRRRLRKDLALRNNENSACA